LKLQYDEALSNFSFNLNLRRYKVGTGAAEEVLPLLPATGGSSGADTNGGGGSQSSKAPPLPFPELALLPTGTAAAAVLVSGGLGVVSTMIGQPAGRGLPSSAFWLNLSEFCGPGVNV